MTSRSLIFLMVVLAAIPISAKTPSSRNPYPNELRQFRFYVKHLAPLRPYISDRTAVVRVFGSSQGAEFGTWSFWPHFVGDGNTIGGHPWAHDITGRLASIVIIPKVRVSMLGVKFPSTFTHGLGSMSEINVSCDVYSDSFGLQYWLYAEDSGTQKKGDLMRIEYGPSKRVARKIVGSS